MSRKVSNTLKAEILSLAKQRHEAIRDFLNQEPIHSDILSFLKEKIGDGCELRIFETMLESRNPIPNEIISTIYKIAKPVVTKTIKKLDEYLRMFSATIEPLKIARKTICIPLKDGGCSVGYHFACLNTKTKEYLDGSSTKKLFENLYDNFNRAELCKKLQKEAQNELTKKLGGLADYQVLDMEIGVIDESKNIIEEDDGRYSHNRKWTYFEKTRLENPDSVYILSSETGTGKTTFLRYLQKRIIENTKLIPIFLNAASIENIDFINFNKDNFIASIAKYFTGYLTKENEKDFFKNHFDDVIFLIDGIDQITGSGTEYRILVDNLISMVKNKIIITSRPYAVIHYETNQKVNFLRLKPFNSKNVETYFGQDYLRAKELCKTCQEMLRVPMLAYMVRQLIEEGRDLHIRNRTDLYKKFIEYILIDGYDHNNVNRSYHEEVKIPNAFREVSYKSIAHSTPFLQKIPLSFAVGCIDDDIKVDRLLKYGLAHIIVNRVEGTNKYLYFSHQSFQEYLAAEFISKDENRIEQVLKEKWNPKWKEVIKFLSGIKGQELIEKILDENDNFIHSKLFFSAELIPEANVTLKFKNNVSDKIKNLINIPLCNVDAKKSWFFVNKEEAMKWLFSSLEDNDADIRTSALYILQKVNIDIDNEIIDELIIMLNDTNETVRRNASDSLIKFREKVDNIAVSKIVDMLEDENNNIRYLAIDTLVKMKIKPNNDIIKKVIKKFDDEDGWVIDSALQFLTDIKYDLNSEDEKRLLERIEDKDVSIRAMVIQYLAENNKINDVTFKKIINKLEDENLEEINVVLYVVEILNEKVDSNVIKKIILRLEDKNYWVRSDALNVLANFKKNMNYKYMCKLVNKLEDDAPRVRENTIKALIKLEQKVDSKIIKLIVDKLDNESIWIRKSVVKAIVEFKDRIDRENINRLVSKLKNEDSWICQSVIIALMEIKDKLDDKSVIKIADLANISYTQIDNHTNILLKCKNKIDRKIIDGLIENLENNDNKVRSI